MSTTFFTLIADLGFDFPNGHQKLPYWRLEVKKVGRGFAVSARFLSADRSTDPIPVKPSVKDGVLSFLPKTGEYIRPSLNFRKAGKGWVWIESFGMCEIPDDTYHIVHGQEVLDQFFRLKKKG